MKVYIIISIKLLFILAAVYYFSSSKDQLKTYENTPICLQSQTVHKICAQCFNRQQQFIHTKGYHIVSNGPIGVLKISSKEQYLSCNQKLQLIDFERDHAQAQHFNLQPLEPIYKILMHMKAKFLAQKLQDSQSQYIIQPWYHQFVVYKWKQYSKQTPVSVTSVNPQFYNNVKTNLLYIFNFVSLLVLVAWLADSSFITSLSKPIKYSLIVIVICFQLWLLGIAKWWCHYLLRLFVLNLGLFKLKVNNLRVLGYIGLGLLMTYFPFTICLYTGLITILVAYHGKDYPQTKSIKLYLVIFYTLLLLNYSYWYQFSIYLNDVHSVVIQFCVLMFIPTGVFLLPDQIHRRPYEPLGELERKPMNKGIYLSGHDDQEQNQE